MKRLRTLRRWFAQKFGFARVLCLLMLVGFAALRMLDPVPIRELRVRTFDTFQLLDPRVKKIKPVTIVDIDEKSLAKLGQWPWPRTTIADMIVNLTNLGAVVIGFDVVFSEPDRTSPAAIAERYAQTGRSEGLPEAFARLPSHDALFAESFGEVPVVTAFFLERTRRGRDVEPKASFTLHGSLPVAQPP